MRFFKLSNGDIINLEAIASITKPNPYNNHHEYSIILTSGSVYKCYDNIEKKENISVPLFGNSVLKYEDLMELIRDYVIEENANGIRKKIC